MAIKEIPEDVKKDLEQKLKNETEKLEKMIEERLALSRKIKYVRDLVVSLEIILGREEN